MSITSPPDRGSSDPPSEPPQATGNKARINGHETTSTTNITGEVGQSESPPSEALSNAIVSDESDDGAPDSDARETLPVALAPDWAPPEPPTFIADLAQSCAGFIERAIGVRPDFTSDTLSLLDHYLRAAGSNTEQKPSAQALVAHSAAAYFGEVARRRFQAWWYAPNDDPSTWELRFHDVYLAFSPLAIVYAAMITPSKNDKSFSAFQIDEADQEEVSSYLAALPEVPEDEFYLPSTRYDTLETIVELLRGLTQQRGHTDVFFDDDDYDDE